VAKRLQTTLGIVTKRFDFSESSRIVQICTRDFGRLSFLAKGAHRPNSAFLGALDLFHVGQCRVRVLEGRGIQTIFSMQLETGNREFRRAPLRLSLAYHISELIRVAMPEGRSDPQLFDLFQGALGLVRRAALPALPTVNAGIKLRLLDALGVLPPLDQCPVEGVPLPRRGRIAFLPEVGGFALPSEALTRKKARSVRAELATLAQDILTTEGRRLLTLRAPLAPLLALHPLLTELMDWQLGDAVRVRCPENLFAAAKAEARIRS